MSSDGTTFFQMKQPVSHNNNSNTQCNVSLQKMQFSVPALFWLTKRDTSFTNTDIEEWGTRRECKIRMEEGVLCVGLFLGWSRMPRRINDFFLVSSGPWPMEQSFQKKRCHVADAL